MTYAAPRRCALQGMVLRKEETGEKKTGKLLEDGDGERGAGGVSFKFSVWTQQKVISPNKRIYAPLAGRIFSFRLWGVPPLSPTMPETTKNFFQYCDKQAKCQSLRMCWGYTALFGGAARGRNISKYGEKKNGVCTKFWAVIYTNIWIPVFASVGGGLVFVLLYSPILPGKYN